jgi:hypothetical protein
MRRILPLAGLLSVAARPQTRTSEIVQLRIEAGGAQTTTYNQEDPFPIRCRFKNLADAPVTIVLPGFGAEPTVSTLGFAVVLRKANGKEPPIRRQTDFRADLCRKTSGKMAYNLECDSPLDSIALRPHEELVRTVNLGTLLGGSVKPAKMPPGEYFLLSVRSIVDNT